MAKQLIYVLDGTFLDDGLDRIPLHKSMTLFMGGVGVKAIDGTVEGAMLKFFPERLTLVCCFCSRNFYVACFRILIFDSSEKRFACRLQCLIMGANV